MQHLGGNSLQEQATLCPGNGGSPRALIAGALAMLFRKQHQGGVCTRQQTDLQAASVLPCSCGSGSSQTLVLTEGDGDRRACYPVLTQVPREPLGPAQDAGGRPTALRWLCLSPPGKEGDVGPQLWRPRLWVDFRSRWFSAPPKQSYS